MSTTTTSHTSGEQSSQTPGNLRVGIQKFGSFLSGMIMPIIPALIAWGLITAVVVNIAEFAGEWAPSTALSSVIDPMIHYLLPILIAVQGGKMVYEMRGAVVGAVATTGVIAGSDWLLGEPAIHMFIGAMIMGPLSAYVMKRLDQLWENRIRSGFEMLVNMFSAGILGFVMTVVGFFGLAPIVNGLMTILGNAVNFLVENGLLPLTSIIIEPAKVFFLNNAINHGVLTPLGLTEASGPSGQSVLFLLESNPGPGLGILLAFSVFGVGAARATAPGAALIHFVGGIHEVYFPYVLMKPMLLLAVIAGGATGVATNVLFDVGLRAPAAPGSIIAIYLQAATNSYVGVTISVILSTVVTFLIAAVILRSSRQRDAENDDAFNQAVAKTAQNKGKSSAHLSRLGASGAAEISSAIRTIYFACDAGMGSSAMGASVLKKKIRAAGFDDVLVTNKAIASLPGDADLVITQQSLTERAKPREPEAIHISVDNFMNAPEYDQIVAMVEQSRELTSVGAGGSSTASAGEPTASLGAGSGAMSSATVADDAYSEYDVDSTEAPAAGGAESTPAVRILDLARVQIVSESTSQEAALAYTAQLLQDAGAVGPDYLESMKEREATVSTYMGNGLAIPHGTNAAKATIKASAISVLRYEDTVNWDGKEASFVIGIAAVNNEHMKILSAIARIFSDTEKVAALHAATDERQILRLLENEI